MNILGILMAAVLVIMAYCRGRLDEAKRKQWWQI